MPLLILLSAALDAPYTVMAVPGSTHVNGGPCHGLTVPLDTFTIQPYPFATIPGTTACIRSSGAWTFASNINRRRRSG